jgi:general secretion pathway protein E
MSDDDSERSTVEAAGDRLKHFASRLKDLIEQARSDDDDEDERESIEAETLLSDAAEARATDVHLDPGEDTYRVRFRVDGELVEITRLERELGIRIVNQLRALARLDPVRATEPGSGRFSYMLDDYELDVRVTEAPCIDGDKLSVRLLTPARVVTDIEQLGLDESGVGYLRDWLETVGGMLLTVGPTGSGKTTTLYALLHQLKMTEAEVVTLEHPVEYGIDGINQIPVNPAQGLDFATGAKGMLRLDPDYLVIGELRDQHSAEAAINAAAGGRATMASLHARDAVDSVTVLRNFGLDDFEIASNLDLVVSQRLVRRLCSDCIEPTEPAARDRAWLDSQDFDVPDEVYHGTGCDTCGGLGYRGRIGLFEIWSPTDDDYEAIVEHCPTHRLRHALAERKHRFLLDDGMSKVREGLVALADLRRLGALGARQALDEPSLVSRRT